MATIELRGAWTNEQDAIANQGGPLDIVINVARGADSNEDLTFLREGWNVRSLEILDPGLVSSRGIESVSANLISLRLAAVSPKFSLGDVMASMANLDDLGAPWSAIKDGLPSLPSKLSTLYIEKYKKPSLEGIPSTLPIAHLALKDRPLLESLDGIEGLPLETLTIASAYRLADFNALSTLTSISELKLPGSSKLSNLDWAPSLNEIRLLSIEDCKDIESLSPLEGLKHLSIIYMGGTTRILDGDLRPLERLPALRVLMAANRRNYVPSVEQLKSQLSI